MGGGRLTPAARRFLRSVSRLNTLMDGVVGDDEYSNGAATDCLVSLGFGRAESTSLVESLGLVRPGGRRALLDALLASRRGPVPHEEVMRILKDVLESNVRFADERDAILTGG